MTIRKVSEFQAQLARTIASGVQFISRHEFACSRFCWQGLRAQSHLILLDANQCETTPEAKAWAVAIIAHLDARKDTRKSPAQTWLNRKVKRAARLGLLPKATT